MTDLAIALQKIGQQHSAALDEAFSAWYPEFKKIAHARLTRSGLGGSMQTTALVHDSYMKLATGPDRDFSNRLQFLAYASRTLRSIVIDTIREERALRRGGDLDLVTLDTAVQEGIGASIDVEAVNTALDDLAKLDPALAQLVEMRFFGGMTALEIAEALGISERSVQREWNKARSVNSSGGSAVKARSGLTTTAANFRFVVNATGAINSSDISAVKVRSRLTLPP